MRIPVMQTSWPSIVNARAALQFSDYGYVLETGAVVLAAPSRDLADDPRVAETYLGGDKRSH